ncbi:hypothetical protein [Butyrivibrio proteoclasticus]|uniref:hypothetical protein n=1 Tax=Butyrivibrio proteoclasticus TaxID=43305 RepID=UPI0004798763|nr:hypothetical protein [Butyrivibrio proteoclasticus]
MPKDLRKKLQIVDRVSTFLALILTIVAFSMPGSTASADGYEDWSWIAGTTADGALESGLDLGETSNETSTGDDSESNKEPSTIEKMLSGLVASLGTQVSRTLNAVSGVPMTITSIIMGKIATGGNSFFTFDLTDGNVYGGIGAYLYVTLQQLALTFVFAVSLFSVVKAMWKGDSKAGQFLKDNIVAFAGAMILLFIMPNIIDAVCIIRDNLSIVMYNTLTGLAPNLNFANGIEAGYKDLYETTPNMVNAVAYALVCFLPLTYVFSYIKIAIMQLILFGLFPMFVFAGFLDNKQSIGQWCVTFFTNCFVPVIDIALMLLPSILLSAMSEAAGDTSNFEGSFVQGLIMWIMFQAIVPTRNQILSMLGNRFGISNGKGLIGLAAGVAGAAKGAITGAMAMAGGIKSGIDKHNQHKAEKNAEREKGSEEKRAADGISKKLGELDAPKSGNGSSKADSEDSKAKGSQPTINDEIPGRNESEGNAQQMGSVASDMQAAGIEPNPDKDAKLLGDLDGGVAASTNSNTSIDADISAGTPDIGDVPSGTEPVSNDVNDAIADSIVTAKDITNANKQYDAKAEDQSSDVLDAHAVISNSANGDEFNNASRYANLKTMDNMNAKISGINDENAKLGALNVQDKAQLRSQEKELKSLESGAWTKVPDGRQRMQDLKSSNEQLRSNIESRNGKIANNNASKAVLNSEVAKRATFEKQYAGAKQEEAFSNATSFRQKLVADKYADIVNKPVSGGALSASQRAEQVRAADYRSMKARLASGTLASAEKATVMVGAAVGMMASVGATSEQEYFKGADSSAGKIYHAAKDYVQSGQAEATAEKFVDDVASAGKGAAAVGKAVGKGAVAAGKAVDSASSKALNFAKNKGMNLGTVRK